MSMIAEKVFETVKGLPELQAAEVLDFAEFLKARVGQPSNGNTEKALESLEQDFFDYAGIWQDRDINQETLRADAWRENQP